MVALPSRTSFEPAVVEYCAATATFCTSGRLNKAVKMSVAAVWIWPGLCVEAVFDSASAVESSAVWKAARAALARV